jgi:hypothetical protein
MKNTGLYVTRCIHLINISQPNEHKHVRFWGVTVLERSGTSVNYSPASVCSFSSRDEPSPDHHSPILRVMAAQLLKLILRVCACACVLLHGLCYRYLCSSVSHGLKEYVSIYSYSLRAGRSGERIPVGASFSTRQDWPWGLPSLLYNGYWVIPGGKATRAWRWPPTSI